MLKYKTYNAHGVGEVARQHEREEALAQLPVVRVVPVDEHVELVAVPVQVAVEHQLVLVHQPASTTHEHEVLVPSTSNERQSAPAHDYKGSTH